MRIETLRVKMKDHTPHIYTSIYIIIGEAERNTN